MKKSVASVAVAFVIVSYLPTGSFAADKKPLATNVAAVVKNKVQKVLCRNTDAVPHLPKPLAAPKMTRKDKPQKNLMLTFKTNCGDIVISADATKAPLTVRAIGMLASNGFYDDSLCHRLTTEGIFVLQCGDPTESGRGGPAFMIPDEWVPQAVTNNYSAGVVAMANSGPNTNGSQFFIVYADTTLNPNYTVWGQVLKGLEIVKAVAAMGVVNGGTDGAPVQKIAIERVIVR